MLRKLLTLSLLSLSALPIACGDSSDSDSPNTDPTDTTTSSTSSGGTGPNGSSSGDPQHGSSSGDPQHGSSSGDPQHGSSSGDTTDASTGDDADTDDSLACRPVNVDRCYRRVTMQYGELCSTINGDADFIQVNLDSWLTQYRSDANCALNPPVECAEGYACSYDNGIVSEDVRLIVPAEGEILWVRARQIKEPGKASVSCTTQFTFTAAAPEYCAP